MLFSRKKITRDGRLVTKDEILWTDPEWKTTISKHGNDGKYTVVKEGKYLGEFNSFQEAFEQIKDIRNKSKDSITEGAKIVVNTENHVNESAIAVTINESDCLVRFENGDEETVPIEAVSAFESMANDGAPLTIRDIKNTARTLGYKISSEKAGDILDELDNNPTANDQTIVGLIKKWGTQDAEAEETNTQIAELTKNMDIARARGYDTSGYKKQIAKLRSKDADNSQEVMSALKKEYGEEKGEQVFNAMKSSGKIGGID